MCLVPDLAVSVRIITRAAARRIVTAAFEYAKKRGFKGVTICEKPNVVRETSGMMEETAKEVAKNYPGIALWSTNIDAQLMWLNKNPEDYNVIVASNLFGDILSDAFAGLVGGLGFAASGNIGDEVAVFEPTHGSAPKYAELDPPFRARGKTVARSAGRAVRAVWSVGIGQPALNWYVVPTSPSCSDAASTAWAPSWPIAPHFIIHSSKAAASCPAARLATG